mmetsp:Transcript_49612/g.75482  ORF Transcript_49612/g.75482 Transcript_49612/m.75482 type:complete len:193 (-) Transcript_49612:41-619(-)
MKTLGGLARFGNQGAENVHQSAVVLTDKVMAVARTSTKQHHVSNRNDRYAFVETSQRAAVEEEEAEENHVRATDPLVVFQVFETSLLLAALRLRGFCREHLDFGGICQCEHVKWGKKFCVVDPLEQPAPRGFEEADELDDPVVGARADEDDDAEPMVVDPEAVARPDDQDLRAEVRGRIFAPVVSGSGGVGE